MSPRDYCFWLMGAFELSQFNCSSLLSEKSLKEIRSHLSLTLVDTSETYKSRYPDDCLGLNFCRWLNEWLCNSGSCLTPSQLTEIHKRLSATFICEIDPSFRNSAQLQDVHDGVT